jgi:hypothetical protein
MQVADHLYGEHLIVSAMVRASSARLRHATSALLASQKFRRSIALADCNIKAA